MRQSYLSGMRQSYLSGFSYPDVCRSSGLLLRLLLQTHSARARKDPGHSPWGSVYPTEEGNCNLEGNLAAQDLLASSDTHAHQLGMSIRLNIQKSLNCIHTKTEFRHDSNEYLRCNQIQLNTCTLQLFQTWK